MCAKVDPLEITRRRHLQGHIRVHRNRSTTAVDDARDVASLQTLWQNYAQDASHLYTRSMWRVLHAVRKESKVTQSAVLSACRRMLPRSQQFLVFKNVTLTIFRIFRKLMWTKSYFHNFRKFLRKF